MSPWTLCGWLLAVLLGLAVVAITNAVRRTWGTLKAVCMQRWTEAPACSGRSSACARVIG